MYTLVSKQILCMSKRRKAMRGQMSEFSTYKFTGHGLQDQDRTRHNVEMLVARRYPQPRVRYIYKYTFIWQ